jgi:thiamine transport system ATP-binding protein
MLEAIGLTYGYDEGTIANYHYDLEVASGEIACLTGTSGSGKSTCLDLIAGFLEPHDGRVRIDGRDVLTLAPEQRPLTILFQRDNLFEHLSAAQNVALGVNTTLRLSAAEERRVEDALERVGLLAMADRRANRLSGGEQQRVALARCLIRNRPVLLLDEPFGALDAATRADMLVLVRNIVTERSLATLMVTHDFNECDRIAERRYEMSGGHTTRLK